MQQTKLLAGFPKVIFFFQFNFGAKRMLEKKSFWFGDHQRTTAPHLPILVLMGNDESAGGHEKAPLPRQLPTPHLCGFLLAQEWRFAVWLLGTVGQCSQSSVCSLACRAPRVSLAPEGRQTKRHHCLAHWSDLQHIRLFFTTGVHFSS